MDNEKLKEEIEEKIARYRISDGSDFSIKMKTFQKIFPGIDRRKLVTLEYNIFYGNFKNISEHQFLVNEGSRRDNKWKVIIEVEKTQNFSLLIYCHHDIHSESKWILLDDNNKIMGLMHNIDERPGSRIEWRIMPEKIDECQALKKPSSFLLEWLEDNQFFEKEDWEKRQCYWGDEQLEERGAEKALESLTQLVAKNRIKSCSEIEKISDFLDIINKR